MQAAMSLMSGAAPTSAAATADTAMARGDDASLSGSVCLVSCLWRLGPAAASRRSVFFALATCFSDDAANVRREADPSVAPGGLIFLRQCRRVIVPPVCWPFL